MGLQPDEEDHRNSDESTLSSSIVIKATAEGAGFRVPITILATNPPLAKKVIAPYFPDPGSQHSQSTRHQGKNPYGTATNSTHHSRAHHCRDRYRGGNHAIERPFHPGE